MKKFILIVIIFLSSVSPATILAVNSNLDTINQIVCNRFNDDLNKMAAIMDEVRRRQGITETRVAFGGVDTPIKSADYQITFAAEALAFQRAQKYSSATQLRSSLEVLRGKVLRAKNEVGKALE